MRLCVLIFLGVLGMVQLASMSQEFYSENVKSMPKSLERGGTYSDVYQELLEGFKIDGRITMLEIGVQSGGSIAAWNRWFGSHSDFTYVGVDVNPQCKQLDTSDDDQIHIEIGSQLNVTFLGELCARYGPFDIIIDDGGHSTAMLMTSVRALFPCMSDVGWYVMEDTMTLAYNNDMSSSRFDGFTLSDHIAYLRNREWSLFEGLPLSEHLARIYLSMHHFHSKSFVHPLYSGWVKSMELRDGMVLIERAPTIAMTQQAAGSERVACEPVGVLSLFDAEGVQLDLHFAVGSISTAINHHEVLRFAEELCGRYRLTQWGSAEQCAKQVYYRLICSAFCGSHSAFLFPLALDLPGVVWL